MESTEPTRPDSTRQDDLDFGGAHLHAPNFEGARITDGYFVNADFSGDLGGLRLNGVEVAPLVLAELERREPDRRLLRAEDPAALRVAWAMLESRAATTLERVRTLPAAAAYERVDGEWSYVETLRHLIMATDCWLRRMVRGDPHPYHPWGLAGTWLSDPSAWGIDVGATPSLDDVVAVRSERMGEVRATIEALDVDELARECVPPPTPGHPDRPHTVLRCLQVICNEEWEHDHYANRDLDVLASRSQGQGAVPDGGSGVSR